MDPIPIPGAEIYYDEHFLQNEEATRLFETLLSKCGWERRRASFGHAVPRDEAYYGDPGTHYIYSRYTRGDSKSRCLGYQNCCL